MFVCLFLIINFSVVPDEISDRKVPPIWSGCNIPENLVRCANLNTFSYLINVLIFAFSIFIRSCFNISVPKLNEIICAHHKDSKVISSWNCVQSK